MGRDGKVLYLGCGDGYTSVHILPNSSNCTLKMGAIFTYEFYLNKVDLKIKFFPGK